MGRSKKQQTARFRKSGLKAAPKAQSLDLALKKIQQAETMVPILRAADQNASASQQEFARLVAEYGVLIREARTQLKKVDGFGKWWAETTPQTQGVVLTAHDRRVVELVIDACNEEHHANGPLLGITTDSTVRHRHVFVTESGPELVVPACERALGLMKEVHRVLAGLPVA